MCMCVYVCVYVYMCICVYVYVYMYMCICMCICVQQCYQKVALLHFVRNSIMFFLVTQVSDIIQ